GAGRVGADAGRHRNLGGRSPDPAPPRTTRRSASLRGPLTTRRSAVLRTGPEQSPVLRAKLSRPNIGEQGLGRSRLTQALAENATRPLTLVIADAGYGKTTLVASFVKAVRRPVVWYSLMPSDADLVVFARYLLAGFRRESPRFGRDFHRALAEARADAR